MLTGRRGFLAGLLATGLAPAPTWADAGSPSYLSAAARPDGRFVLCGIDATLAVAFQIPLPDRGHAAAAHPTRPEAVAFARRPGTFAVVIDCATGTEQTVLQAPRGRHFYGHGAYSQDGRLLFTTENDFEAGRGVVGLWDAARGYARVGEWDSGGIGPHDIKRCPGSDALVVANGGIDTHPDTGRTKLNIPTMRPNLSYLDDGAVIEQIDLPRDMHKNSIRHLAVAPDGTVAFGMQWQGHGPAPALVGLHRFGQEVALMASDPDNLRDMQGYIGSIAIAADGESIAVTSPRGGLVQVFHDGRLQRAHEVADVCGVAAMGDGFALTSGIGTLAQLHGTALRVSTPARLRWDNHLIGL
ncbi:DUF1513 domain-containing protein [Thalassorhabdomicrobium marinisediminis]|uniref:DUF1513 domain-containing protein n=1 Tax=Thalassorhabdomicrobium marinisediminis TaxID=2170577 RepID=UPI0018C89E0A|nr:DUF1513 domain-containing protein [Thalassorhabdomicrobium marinisediminis]